MSEFPPGVGDSHGHLLLEPNNFGQDAGDDRIMPTFAPPAEQPHRRPAHALAATLAHRRRNSEWRWLDCYLDPGSTSETEDTGEDAGADARSEALPAGNAPVQRRPLRRIRRELRRRPAVLVGGVSALAIASLMGLGIAGWAAVSSQEETSPLPAATGLSDVWCPEDGRHTAGPGGTSSGAEVIKAFQHAYYVDRDAEAAVALFSEKADAPTVSSLSRGIEASRGSDHCLKILPTEKADTFHVDLSVRNADGSVEIYPQVVTVSLDDEVLLEQISPRELE